jgi:release factor glutamine methyltransferase
MPSKIPRQGEIMNPSQERAGDEILWDGIRIRTAARVFRPDNGTTTWNIAKILENYAPATALDMGCGTGFLALVLRRNGASVVWAVDADPNAVACARENVKLNEHLQPVTVAHSNLFADLRDCPRFDLVVFHHPYFPASPDELVGAVWDGGDAIIRRFFQQAPAYVHDASVIIMAFQSTAGAENDPMKVAKELGLRSQILREEQDGPVQRRIYEFRFGIGMPQAAY